MLRLHLAPEDLRTVHVGNAPAPLLELGNLVRGRVPNVTPDAATGLRGRPGFEADRELLAALFLLPCTPGFLQPGLTDRAAAIDAVCSVAPDRARHDLAENVISGYPMPAWALELTRPGLGGLRLRRRLERALSRAVQALVEPVLEDVRPRAATWAAGIEATRRAGGTGASLDALGDHVRLRGGVLEVDLFSGAEVEAATSASGLHIVPSLASHPTVSVSNTGAPTTITVPMPCAPNPTSSDEVDATPALADLIGRTRTRLLLLVAFEPGLGVRALARRLDVAPATASQHIRVLRNSGLVKSHETGVTVSALGLQLIRGH